jgi:hypothetical protein
MPTYPARLPCYKPIVDKISAIYGFWAGPWPLGGGERLRVIAPTRRAADDTEPGTNPRA